MGGFKHTFARVEKKYILDEKTYMLFREKTDDYMVGDRYGKSTVCNIYFDTPSFRLIRESVDKPLYKEKLRFRTYDIPDDNSLSFIEIKKKFDGIVYKRRISMKYIDAYNYLMKKNKPQNSSQVFKEIDYMFNLYDGLQAAMVITYDRNAFFCKENQNLRITYDSNIIWRIDELDLRQGVFGETLLDEGRRVMEIKIPGSMPIWLCKALDDLKIYPASYSKYGNAYKILKSKTTIGVNEKIPATV